MSKKGLELQNRWLLLGATPNLLLAIGYIFSDFYFSSSSVKSRATIFLFAVCVTSLLACLSVYKVKGWFKILPIFGLTVGAILSAWLLFVLSFSVTF